jgi:beta-lactamase class A
MSSGDLLLSNHELARVSIALVDVDGVTRFENRPNVMSYAASIMKLAVAVAVLGDLDSGRVSPDDLLAYDGGFVSGFDGSRFSIDEDSIDHDLVSSGARLGTGIGSGAGGSNPVGESDHEGGGPEAAPAELFPSHWVRRDASDIAGKAGVSVARALHRSITVSSNEGANLLMQLVGLEAINWVLLEAGCDNSVVERMLFDTPARDAGRTNRLTALDAAQLMWSIRFGTIASDASLTYLCEVLRAQTQRSMIGFALDGAIGRGEVVVGNKEGQTNEVLHDVAFIEPDDTDAFILAVCTDGLTEQAATLAVRKVALYAYENRFSWKSLAANFQ